VNDECLICKVPLVYLEADEPMECSVCHKRENSKTRCVNGHYVCNECHTQGLDAILALCLGETSKDPAAILEKMMANEMLCRFSDAANSRKRKRRIENGR